MRRSPISTLFPYTTLFRSSVESRMLPALFSIRLIADFFVSNRSATCSWVRSEEHTSELQSQSNLVCRLLLEKKNIAKERDLKSSVTRSRRVWLELPRGEAR